MIQPEDIRRKAENLYPRFLLAWLEGQDFFPRTIPAKRQPQRDPATAIASVRRLRDEAKESVGFGYDVEWKEINSRQHGRNLFPRRILFQTQDDFLRFVGRQREFAAFTEAVTKIRERYPQLAPWIRSHRKLLTEVADDVAGLLLVVDYLREHPRPGVFARELPLPLDTKFVERNLRVLGEWLDIVLPPHMIRADERHFERRYGLRYAEPHLLVRFLDPELQRQCGSPWPECSIPLHTLAEMPIPVCRVLVVENKVNLLTLPLLRRTLALGGLGYGVTDLRLLPWLNEATLGYWGDIDVDGMTILSRLRVHFPQTVSLMMDIETVQQWRDSLTELASQRPMEVPPGLTDSELAAFEFCVDENRRIEQERLPQNFVDSILRRGITCCTLTRRQRPESV